MCYKSAAPLAYAGARDVGVETWPAIAGLTCWTWWLDNITAAIEGGGSGVDCEDSAYGKRKEDGSGSDVGDEMHFER